MKSSRIIRIINLSICSHIKDVKVKIKFNITLHEEEDHRALPKINNKLTAKLLFKILIIQSRG